MKTLLNDSSLCMAVLKVKFSLMLIALVVSANVYSTTPDSIRAKVDLIIELDNAIYFSRHFRYQSVKTEIVEMPEENPEERLRTFQGILVEDLNTNLNDSVINRIMTTAYSDTGQSYKSKKNQYKDVNKHFRGGIAEYLSFNILELNKPVLNIEDLKFYISKIQHLETAFQVKYKLQKFIEHELKANPYFNEIAITENLKIVQDHMDKLANDQYVNYAITSQSKTIIKGVNVFHDNDLLAFKDEDRNYTGGAFFEITTDYLKMRVLPNINEDRWLSYQGVFFGVEAYTPEIRDTTIFNSPTSYDTSDRPFASFKYYGRSKYRIHYKGIFRLKAFYKFGTIGSDLGSNVQSIIHRDVSGSVKPQGWDSQIGFPGRFAFQYDEYLETMLFSGQGDLWNHRRNINNSRLLGNINVTNKIGWHLGTQLNAFDIGFSLSNKNFRDQSGSNDIRLPMGKSFQYLVKAEINYRFVRQNTMLEGYNFEWLQFFNKMNNEVDTYVLTSDQVVKRFFFGEIWTGIRTKKLTFYYKYTFTQGEYIIDNKQAPNHYWGTIGINFLM